MAIKKKRQVKKERKQPRPIKNIMRSLFLAGLSKRDAIAIARKSFHAGIDDRTANRSWNRAKVWGKNKEKNNGLKRIAKRTKGKGRIDKLYDEAMPRIYGAIVRAGYKDYAQLEKELETYSSASDFTYKL